MPNISWDFYMHTHGKRNSSQILHGDKTILENFLQAQPCRLPWPQIFATGMRMYNLFAVGNLLIVFILDFLLRLCEIIVLCLCYIFVCSSICEIMSVHMSGEAGLF